MGKRPRTPARDSSKVDPLAALPHAPPGERRVQLLALVLAILAHLAVLTVPLPEARPLPKSQLDRDVRVVRRYVPPPPPPPKPRAIASRAASRKMQRRIPIPDPTPEAPEPIREPLPELPPVLVVDDDVELFIGTPEPPTIPGVDEVEGLVPPVLIPESRVNPKYPEPARRARLQGDVVLDAVIHRDGRVGELRVLSSTAPELGFEDAAIVAVRQWRYEPARLAGRPVAVRFTVFVRFELL